MRKGIMCRIAVLAAAAVLFTGCGAVDSVVGKVRQVLIDKQAEVYAGQFETVSAEAMADVRKEVRETDYAFGQLSEEEQKTYLELLMILTSYREEVRLTSMDPEEVDKVYQAIMMDHPELFYTEGYTITEHTIAEQTEFYTFSGQYTYTKEEREHKQALIDEKVAEILSGIPEDASDYEKEKYVYDYVVLHTDYDEEAPDNQNIISVFLNGASVCQGYAYATQYLLRELGIPCTTVTGHARNREGNLVAHAWNLVKISGDYYFVDTTWGDPVAGPEAETLKIMQDGYVNYDYLNLTTKQMEEDHDPSPNVPLPECTALEYNYYRQEGLLYETYDTKLLSERLKAAMNAGDGYLMMKFPDDEVYGQYMKKLFDGQAIFRIVPSMKSISYTADPESRLLIIYLK